PKVPRTTPCVCNGRPAAARKMPGMRPRRLRTDPEPRRRSRRRGLVAFEGGPRVTLKKNPRNTGARRTDGARVLAAALALGALAGCSGEAAPEAMPPPPQVSAAPVLVREVAHWDEFIGRVEAAQIVELRPRVGGYIERVNYVEGAEVEKGDVLFVIDQRTYRAALARAQAELARARTQAELARTEAERAAALMRDRAISAEELDRRRAAAAQAE